MNDGAPRRWPASFRHHAARLRPYTWIGHPPECDFGAAKRRPDDGGG
jgi:hypothetical protein